MEPAEIEKRSKSLRFRSIRRHGDRSDLVPADLHLVGIRSDRDTAVVVSPEEPGVLGVPHVRGMRLGRHRIDESPAGLRGLDAGKRADDLSCEVWVESEAHARNDTSTVYGVVDSHEQPVRWQRANVPG